MEKNYIRHTVLTNEAILALAQSLYPEIDRFGESREWGNAMVFETKRGSEVIAPVFDYFGRNGFSFRSFLMRQNKSRPASYLINGQASRNMREIGFFGEGGDTILYRDSAPGVLREEGTVWGSERASLIRSFPGVGESPVSVLQGCETLPEVVDAVARMGKEAGLPAHDYGLRRAICSACAVQDVFFAIEDPRRLSPEASADLLIDCFGPKQGLYLIDLSGFQTSRRAMLQAAVRHDIPPKTVSEWFPQLDPRFLAADFAEHTDLPTDEILDSLFGPGKTAGRAGAMETIRGRGVRPGEVADEGGVRV